MRCPGQANDDFLLCPASLLPVFSIHVSPAAELYEDMFLTPQRAAATRPQRKRNRTAGAPPQPVFT